MRALLIVSVLAACTGQSQTVPATGARLEPPRSAVRGSGTCGQASTWRLPTRDVFPVIGSRDSTSQDDAARELVTKARIAEIIFAAERVCATVGAYPTSLVALLEFGNSLPSTASCRFHEHDFLDGWGVPIYYGVGDSGPFAVSAGTDGRFTTDDDIGTPTGTDGVIVIAREHCDPAALPHDGGS